MIGEKVFDDISARVAAAIGSSPIRDVEKNVRVLLRAAQIPFGQIKCDAGHGHDHEHERE